VDSDFLPVTLAAAECIDGRCFPELMNDFNASNDLPDAQAALSKHWSKMLTNIKFHIFTNNFRKVKPGETATQTRVHMSMLPTGTVLPRIPLRCSFKFSDRNRSMSICNQRNVNNIWLSIAHITVNTVHSRRSRLDFCYCRFFFWIRSHVHRGLYLLLMCEFNSISH